MSDLFGVGPGLPGGSKKKSMMGEQAQSLSQRLSGLLDGEVERLPPSDRDRFYAMQSMLQGTSGGNERYYISVWDLSDPEQAHALEKILHHKHFVSSVQSSYTWEDGRLLYYATVAVKPPYYEALRHDLIHPPSPEPTRWERIKRQASDLWEAGASRLRRWRRTAPALWREACIHFYVKGL